MARTVADAAALLGRDDRPRSGRRRRRRARPAAAAVDYTDVARRRRAEGRADRRRAEAVHGLQPGDAIELLEAAIAAMKAQGAVIVDPADIPTAAQLDDCEFEILLYEFKAGLNAYLRQALPATGPGPLACGSDRVQRAREGARDAVLRPGDLDHGAEEGAADVRRLSHGAVQRAAQRCAHAGHRRRRSRRTGSTRSSRRPAARRGRPISSTAITLLGASSTPGRGGGLPEHHRAGGRRSWPAGRPRRSSAQRWSEPKLIALAYAYEQATKHAQAAGVPAHAESADALAHG